MRVRARASLQDLVVRAASCGNPGPLVPAQVTPTNVAPVATIADGNARARCQRLAIEAFMIAFAADGAAGDRRMPPSHKPEGAHEYATLFAALHGAVY